MRDLVRNADILAQLAPLLDRAKVGTISAADAARAYAQIQELRQLADKYERDLIRSLRWDSSGGVVRTWAQVAEVVRADLGSRQAAHARWGALKSPTRGTATQGRPRGAVRPRGTDSPEARV
jgi:hypothetical protein